MMNKKLKLTKLTVANLDRVKGGRPPCACQWTTNDGAFNRDHVTFTCFPCPITVTD